VSEDAWIELRTVDIGSPVLEPLGLKISSTPSHQWGLKLTSFVQVGKASVMATVLELESVYCDTEERGGGGERAGSNHTQEEEMEVAVLLQELCSIKEERADLRYSNRVWCILISVRSLS
jgi:hypothetical protein